MSLGSTIAILLTVFDKFVFFYHWFPSKYI